MINHSLMYFSIHVLCRFHFKVLFVSFCEQFLIRIFLVPFSLPRFAFTIFRSGFSFSDFFFMPRPAFGNGVGASASSSADRFKDIRADPPFSGSEFICEFGAYLDP